MWSITSMTKVMDFIEEVGCRAVPEESVVPKFVPQDAQIRNIHCPPSQFNQTGAVQTAEIARNQVPNSSEPGGQFLVIFCQLKLNSARSQLPGFICKSNQTGDQTPPDSREGQLLDQTREMAQPMPENFENLQRQFGVLKANSPELIGLAVVRAPWRQLPQQWRENVRRRRQALLPMNCPPVQSR